MKKDKKYLNNVKLSVFIVGILFSIFGFIQLLIFPDLSKLDPTLLWDPHHGRLVSTLFDPNFVAIILLFPMIINVVYLFKTLSSKKKNRLLIIAFGISFLVLFIAEILTYSRSGLLAIAIVLFLVSVIRYRFVLLISIFLFFSMYYFVPRVQTRLSGITDPSDSFYFRYISWNNAVNIMKEKPIIGYGYNAYRYIQEDKGYFNYSNKLGNRSGAGSDSSLLQIGATTGIVGLAFYVFSFISIFSLSVKRYFGKVKLKRSIFILLFISFVPALLVESQFINSLLYPSVMLFWLLFVNFILSSED